MAKKKPCFDIDNVIFPIAYPKCFDFSDKDAVVRHIVRKTLNKTLSMFRYKNLPETIPEDMLKLQLQTVGYAVFDKITPEDIKANQSLDFPTGVYSFSEGVGLGGVPDAYYRPTLAIINSPAFGYSASKRINKECFLLRNDPLFEGLLPIIGHYASLMTENLLTMRVTDINTRIMSILTAQDDAQANAITLFLQDIENGKLSSVLGKDLFDDDGGVRSLPYGGKTDTFAYLIEYHQYLKASLLNELGINANYNMKRESLNFNETEVNKGALLPFIDTMLRTQTEDLKRINDAYGLDISVELNSSWEDVQDVVDKELDNSNNDPTPSGDPEPDKDPEPEKDPEDKGGNDDGE